MPYINIREEDIQTIQGFDQIDNVVLIFGFNYKLQNNSTEASKVKETLGFDYKLYTSLNDFVKDIRDSATMPDLSTGEEVMNFAAYRPYVTAYDCLANGLPVIYVPIDKFIPDEAILKPFSGEGSEKTFGNDYVMYKWLSEPSKVPDLDDDFWKTIDNKEQAYAYYMGTLDSEGHYTGERHIPAILSNYINVGVDNGGLDFADKINFPVTFVTTCGFEDFRHDETALAAKIIARFKGRLDLLYLYDIPADIKPEDVVQNDRQEGAVGAIAIPHGEISNIVYPWGTYNSYLGARGIHMPGSYGYLMAYAVSIKNNRPWLAVAGVTRGAIPNIVNVDYKISESFVHDFQGDDAATKNLQFRINPIVDFGSNYGKVIFGNRTNFNPNELVFRSFLNVRLLLIYIHKQAFASSIQHMFEPNDDIVWLSFKQKVNLLLDQMVSGRGIKWYKWAKIVPDKLGQIKARLTIRPIEAVESFDIVISMVDADITVAEGE